MLRWSFPIESFEGRGTIERRNTDVVRSIRAVVSNGSMRGASSMLAPRANDRRPERVSHRLFIGDSGIRRAAARPA
jgi:hypothetical protein